MEQYTVTLSDGTNTVGIMTSNKTNIRRLPRGAGVERKTARQMTWNGGRGNDRFATDQTRFGDSMSLWTMVNNWAISGPLFTLARFGNAVSALKPAEYFAWGSVPSFEAHNETFTSVAGDDVAREFVPGSSFTMRRLAFWVRGASLNGLHVEIRSDAAGTPDTVLWSEDVVAVGTTDEYKPGAFVTFDPNLALTGGTTYWIVVRMSASRYVGMDTGTDGKKKNGAGAWGACPYAPLFYVADALAAYRAMHFFEYKRGLYMVTQRSDSGAATLWLNGDRGMATGAQTTTTLKDTTKAWTVNEWAGCVCLIISGANEFEYATIASNTADTLTLSTAWPTAPVAGAGGSVYVILGSDKWTEIGTTGLTVPATAVCVANGIVYMAQGDGVNIRRMQEVDSAGTWTRSFADDGTNKAKLLRNAAHWSSGAQAVYRTNGANQVSVAPVVAWGTNLTFETAIECGNTESPIRSLSDYDNELWAVKDDGVWSLKNGKFGRVPFGMEAARDERNGVAATGWNQQFYFSLLDGLERLYGNVVDDIGPNRDESMPYDRRGAITQLVPVAQYLLAAYDAGSGRSSVLATTSPGGDWHEIFRCAEAGRRVRSLHYQTVPGKANRLWLMYGHLIGYLQMPDDIHNPMNDVNMRFAPESHLVTAWFDFETPEMDHLFRQARITTQNCDPGYGVRLEYEVWPTQQAVEDWRSITWHDVGDEVTESQDVATRTIGTGNVTGNRIRFRVSVPSDTVTPLGLKAFELRGDTMNEVLYDFIFDLREDDGMMLMDGSDRTESTAEALGILEQWKEDAVLLTMQVAGDSTGLFSAVLGHIDPVSLVTQEWNERSVKLAGNIVFKQTA